MKTNDKIHVKEYLNFLNDDTNHAIIYGNLNKKYVNPIKTCKELAERCNVTPATISNLTTSSSYYLLDKIANEIFDAFYGFFSYNEAEDRKENTDEIIYPRDKYYVLRYLTNYYTDEWLNP